MSSEAIMPATAEAPSNSQRLFVRYFTAILIDLLVLNLFVEYSENVTIDSFTMSLLRRRGIAGTPQVDHSRRAPGGRVLQGKKSPAASILSFDSFLRGWCYSGRSSLSSRR